MERRTLAALTVVLLVAVVLAGRYFWVGRPEAVRPPDVVGHALPAATPTPTTETAEGEEPKPPGMPQPGPKGSGPPGPGGPGAGAPTPMVVVDVSGKVLKPGVLRLPAGARVVDALHAAGGVRPGTDVTGLNRARVLVDGEHVVVGVPGVAGGVPTPAAGQAAVGGPFAAAGPISLNSATVEQLDTLPGVGPVLARQIIEHRTRHGGFRSVDELREVRGIGDRRFADLRPLVRP
ncbi:ComEA family DNA-binding protein [Streptomyces sp. TRM64462]|uniref:ComEA family DNA-binding protein n=1 Tax=Streptomyces sp. TRM64462 TaxID=2741726 RepID=UPI002814B4CD|nr:ComEA family DNA-binding protein [Streptomyces sp. TRM64462]